MNKNNERLLSIDILRGADMFLITGGGTLLTVLLAFIFQGKTPEWLRYHFTHVDWIGFAAWDLIMPLFIFIVGASIPFAFQKFVSGEVPRRKAYGRILKRFVVLNLFGMVSQGNLLQFKWDHFIFISDTLQAIAFGYLIASLLYLHVGWKVRSGCVIGFLFLYSVLLLFVPFDGNSAGTLIKECNLALYVESMFGSHQGHGFYAWVLPILSFGALTVRKSS